MGLKPWDSNDDAPKMGLPCSSSVLCLWFLTHTPTESEPCPAISTHGLSIFPVVLFCHASDDGFLSITNLTSNFHAHRAAWTCMLAQSASSASWAPGRCWARRRWRPRSTSRTLTRAQPAAAACCASTRTRTRPLCAWARPTRSSAFAPCASSPRWVLFSPGAVLD